MLLPMTQPRMLLPMTQPRMLLPKADNAGSRATARRPDLVIVRISLFSSIEESALTRQSDRGYIACP
jgi:hypothetical protein